MIVDTLPNLYSITGHVLDINTMLVNRAELRRQHQEIQALKQAKGELLEVLQDLGDVPCPLEVYNWLVHKGILSAREAVISKYKD